MPAPKDPEHRARWIEENRARAKSRMSDPEFKANAIRHIKDAPKLRKGTPEYEAWKNSPAYETWAKNQYRKIWTKEEVSILQENYPTHTAKEMESLLPGRTEKSISFKAMELKLAKRPPRSPDAPKGEYVSLWEKRCTRCGEVKLLEEFRYEKRRGKHTYSCACIECDRATQRERAYKRYASHHRELPPGQRYCSACDTIKPIEQFINSNVSKSGHGHWCKDCARQYKRVTSTGRQQPNLTATIRRGALKRYGITLEQYAIMLEAQQGVCAVCRNPETSVNATKTGKVASLGVDHDHCTGNVRGLLCQRCNQALGLLQDDSALIESLLIYLETAQKPNPSEDFQLPSEKTCGKCNEIKLITEFKQGRVKKHCYSIWCQTCIRHFPEEYRSSSEVFRANNLMHAYGISIDEYHARMTRQNSVCAVCYKPETVINHISGKVSPLSVDHDHQTGKVRGLLCCRCNHALGLLKDDMERIGSLLSYIRSHQISTSENS